MKFISPSSVFPSVLAALLIFVPMAGAANLMFDFGPTTPTGSNLTNSPGHFAGAIPLSSTSWNIAGTGNLSSGLLYADGTAAGISLRTGTESSASSDSIDFTTNPSTSSALGTAIQNGIYDGDSVAKDGIFQSTNDFAIGVQISGLAAGAYGIYLSGRNTNVGPSPGQNFYAAASPAGDAFDFGSLPAFSASNPGSAGWASWTEGETYALIAVTLVEGQVLNIASEGAETGAGGRGFLNSIQIVAIPEPPALALVACSLLVPLVLILRRRTGI